MSTQARATQFATSVRSFFGLEPEKLMQALPRFSDYDGPNLEEVKATLDHMRVIYIPLIDTTKLAALPQNTIANLQNLMQTVVTAYNQLLAARDQGSFQAFASALDQFAQQTRLQGIAYEASSSEVLEELRTSMTKDLERLRLNNDQVEKLTKEVRNLITPAVAGALSKSFTDRRNTLMIGRVIWAASAFALGLVAIIATYRFAGEISTSMSAMRTGGASENLWPVIAIRSIVLFPLFAAFGFTFSQYRKERDFEEEYAHKAAVATSLPNYGDLASDQKVRDQIVTGATNVIFSSPTTSAKQAELSESTVRGVEGIIDSIGKAVGRK